MTEPCTCLTRNCDDQCPTHGYEAWLKSKDSPVEGDLEGIMAVSGCCGMDGHLLCCSSGQEQLDIDVEQGR